MPIRIQQIQLAERSGRSIGSSVCLHTVSLPICFPRMYLPHHSPRRYIQNLAYRDTRTKFNAINITQFTSQVLHILHSQSSSKLLSAVYSRRTRVSRLTHSFAYPSVLHWRVLPGRQKIHSFNARIHIVSPLENQKIPQAIDQDRTRTYSAGNS